MHKLRKYRFYFLFPLIYISFTSFLKSQDAEKEVYRIEVSGVIDLGIAPFIKRAIEEANKNNIDAIILEINTLGGRIDAATQIRDALLDSKVKTIAFINKRAISAGALISLACKKIIIAEGGTIGAATPVQIGMGEQKETSEKTVSYFRNEMKATAEKNGKRGDIAAAMVDKDIEIKGLTEKGKLVTLTTEDAIKYKIADFVANDIDEALDKVGLAKAKIVNKKINWAEKIARLLTHPIVSSLLMSLGFLGLLMELKSPGFGFTGIIGITCLLLFFAGHYVVNLAGFEELGIFVLGVTLLAIELFAIPGFGIVGIIGILLVFGSLVFSLINTDIPLTLPDISGALSRVGISIIITITASLIIIKYIPSCTIGRRLILGSRLKKENGAEIKLDDVKIEDILNKEGIALTALRPAGSIKINDKKYDAVTQGDFIEKGNRIIVIKVEGNKIVVKKILK